MPEFATLFGEVAANPDRARTAEIQTGPPNHRRILLVRIGAELSGGRTDGFVVTFDDITELQSAQRKAAWADVARRIAHEIKNPLTPIQLSAERLKRRFAKEIQSDPETFAQCADTIIRHVGDIGRMVDEFSAFARMPQPVIKPEDVGRIAREALVLQKTARPGIEWITDIPERGPVVPCDRRMLRQALTNLLQNAADAVAMRDGAGHITLTVRDLPNEARIIVGDDGVGLPKEERARLTEPYVTHKPKGTGLGLAIVKKIMEDHGGALTLGDQPNGPGAVASLMLPRVPVAVQGAASSRWRNDAGVRMAHEILIVDDEPDIRLLIEGTLRDEGYETRGAGDAEQAIAAFRSRRPSLVILDVWLQGSRMDGIGILETLQSEEPHVPVVMISGHGTIEMAVGAIQHGAYDFIEKPFQSDRLLLVVRRALEAAALARENAELRLRAGPEATLTGESALIAQLRSQVERVAPTGSRVMISGPAGSGKEVVARVIHSRSRRSTGPFVVMNCATLNPGRFEEELFGMEAGGDPMAHPRRAGVLERAHGGTLLLDEVSDMPLETQGKIVRALQDQTFERLGGSARVKVDVRVLSTTNRDLQTEIATGRFREDLYYRLAVVPVRVPALRERREDVPILAQYFIERSAESSGIPVRALSADTLAALQAYDWPGNVRQLRNLMDWLLIMAPGACGGSYSGGYAAAGDRVARAGFAEYRPDRRYHVAAAA